MTAASAAASACQALNRLGRLAFGGVAFGAFGAFVGDVCTTPGVFVFGVFVFGFGVFGFIVERRSMWAWQQKMPTTPHFLGRGARFLPSNIVLG